MRRALLAWGPVALWAGLLLFAGTRASEDLPAAGVFDLFEGADKAVHAAAYGLLGALVQRAAARRSALGALAAGCAAALAVGGGDELLQVHAPGRMPDLLDLAADLAGAALGAWLWFRTFPPPARSRG